MSLMTMLAETYDACAATERSTVPPALVPVYHTTQMAQIEVTLDLEGTFCTAMVTESTDRMTIIPCTENSASRSGINPQPHPLFDKLQYLTPEYADQDRKSKGSFDAYRKQLSAWCASPFAHESVKAVLTYLENGTLLNDLADAGVLHQANDGTFPAKKPENATTHSYPIFGACKYDQLDAFVRFCVWGVEDNDRLWESNAAQQSWIDYQNSLIEQKIPCCISGELQAPSRKSPRNIRWPGDGAKLVSSNDSIGYTFRGRFASADEALCIGREANEKAHNALRWLIAQQGYRHKDQIIVAWFSGRAVPKAIFEDTRFASAAFGKEADDLREQSGFTACPEQPDDNAGKTGRTSAKSFAVAIAGYRGVIDGMEPAAIVGLSSATPGRLSVFYYRETNATDLLDRVFAWHEGCKWRHDYTEPAANTKEAADQRVYYTGAPSPKTIAKAIYGEKAGSSLISKTIERLLPCIAEGAPIPQDIVMSALRRASRPTTLEPWEASRAHSVACSLIRKYNNDRYPEEEITMETAKDLKDRDTKFGVVLAYMRRIEEKSLYLGDQKSVRSTNAERYQEQFVKKPESTLLMLHKRIQPHLRKLAAYGDTWLELNMLDAISKLNADDMTDKPLGPRYLTGYASQYLELRPSHKSPRKNETQSFENENPAFDAE